MKILHVDKFLRRIGGSSGYMLDLADAQRARGHEVEFFSMAHVDNIAATYAEHFPPWIDFSARPESLGDGFVRVRTMFASADARRGMERVLDAFRPDVVHLHSIYHQLSPSILRPVGRQAIPTVMTVHDYKLVCPTYRMIDANGPCTACLDGHYRHAVARRCRDGSLVSSSLMAAESAYQRAFHTYAPVGRLIAPSRFIAEQLTRGGYAPQRVVHVPHFFEPLPGVGATAVAPRRSVIYAGRLSDEKGVDVVVKAVGLVPDVVLDIAGDGPERAALVALAEQVAPGRVHFHGMLPKAALLELMSTSSVGVLMARWFENQPIAVLESLGSGLPMICSDLGGLPELVTHGENGLVVPMDDHVALAGAIRTIVDDPQTRARMSSTARRLIAERHGRDRHLDAVEQQYAAADPRGGTSSS